MIREVALMSWCIYKHTSPSGKCYIGMTSKMPEQRWLDGNGYNLKTKFGKAITKYGWSNFTHEILEVGIETLTMAQEREKYYIKFFDSFKNGYNSTEGGDSVAPDIIQKRKVICYETQEIFDSTVEAGEKYQIEHSNISRACKTRVAAKGKHFLYLEDWDTNWKPFDKRTNISKTKMVICEETQQIFSSVREASRVINITASLISRCCNGQLKSTHGYHFNFIKKEEE